MFGVLLMLVGLIGLPTIPDVSELDCALERTMPCSAGFISVRYCSSGEEAPIDRLVVRTVFWHGKPRIHVRYPRGQLSGGEVWFDYEGDGVSDEFYASFEALRAVGHGNVCDSLDHVVEKLEALGRQDACFGC